MHPVAFFSPAKLNLFLAITGRRDDGFHELVSLAAPLAWGDRLEARPASGFSLECTDPAVPVDETNLVLRAARAFATATGWKGGAHFRLGKRIPMGAGLGGGSSNAAAALRALNVLSGGLLGPGELRGLAAQVGSDCALFLHDGPVVMRGRGERIEALPPAVAARLAGRRVLVFKPSFGIATPWAYARLAAEARAGSPPGAYLGAAEAERRLAEWCGSAAPVEALLFNQLERVAFAKYPALPALLGELRSVHGLAGGMSGSGSACFALANEGTASTLASIREAWGPDAFVLETELAGVAATTWPEQA